MQSEKTKKKRLHKSAKSLTSVINKPRTFRLLIFLAAVTVLILLGVLIYFNRSTISRTFVYYKNFLNSSNKKSDKTIEYKRLFETAILSREIDKALIYLKEIELLDTKDPSTYIRRLKLFIRMGELPSAKKEIDLHFNKLKRNPDFIMLVGVYYMKSRNYKEAFDIMSRHIRFGKREAPVHKLILHCMLKLNQPEKAVKYLKKLESKKYKFFDNKELKAEFYIIKAIAKLMQNDLSTMEDDLRPGIVSDSFPLVSIKLLIYFRMLNNDHENLLTILNEYENKYEFDADFNKVLGDFFVYKKEYHSALRFYDKIKEIRSFTNEEGLTYADIQYRVGNYSLAAEQLQHLKITYNYDTPLLYKNLSALYARMDNYSDEFFYLNQGNLIYPYDIGFFIRLAKFHIDADNHEKAIQFIEKGMALVEAGKAEYDKRLNILKLAAIKYKNKKMTEQELLTLREKHSGSVENYFKLIEFYLQKGHLKDARRELATAATLPMNDKQKQIYTIYELIYSMKGKDRELYSEVKNRIYEFENSNLLCMYKALLRLLDKNYDKSLEYLNLVNTDNEPDSFKFKKLYLEAVNFYYKGNSPAALQKLKAAGRINPYDTNASFLKAIIKEAQEY